jgi:hypothetical protein
LQHRIDAILYRHKKKSVRIYLARKRLVSPHLESPFQQLLAYPIRKPRIIRNQKL